MRDGNSQTWNVEMFEGPIDLFVKVDAKGCAGLVFLNLKDILERPEAAQDKVMKYEDQW